jgi:hypothetical protein
VRAEMSIPENTKNIIFDSISMERLNEKTESMGTLKPCSP